MTSCVSPAFLVVEDEVKTDFTVDPDGKVVYQHGSVEEIEKLLSKEYFENIWVEGKDLNLQDYTLIEKLCVYIQLEFCNNVLDQQYDGFQEQGRMPHGAFQTLLFNLHNLLV
jgi:hypothetical protein